MKPTDESSSTKDGYDAVELVPCVAALSEFVHLSKDIDDVCNKSISAENVWNCCEMELPSPDVFY